MRTLRPIEIAELLGVTKQRAHQIAQKDFPMPLAEDARGRVWGRSRCRSGRIGGEAKALALGQKLERS
jgi:hypothetical protein